MAHDDLHLKSLLLSKRYRARIAMAVAMAVILLVASGTRFAIRLQNRLIGVRISTLGDGQRLLRFTAERHRLDQQSPSMLAGHRVNEVRRDVHGLATGVHLQIASISGGNEARVESRNRKARIELQGRADYGALKSWGSDLLSRYPSLAVQNLYIRGGQDGFSTPDFQISLVLIVRDEP